MRSQILLDSVTAASFIDLARLAFKPIPEMKYEYVTKYSLSCLMVIKQMSAQLTPTHLGKYFNTAMSSEHPCAYK